LNEDVGVKKTMNEDVLKVHHIGGIGEAGPTGVLANLGKVEWWVYDALEDASISSRACNPAYHVVTRAIADRDGEADFYITRDPSASSLLPVAKSAKDYVIIGADPIPIWGQHAETVKTVKVKVNKIDTLVEQGVVPPVDFLSIDAQGAELMILNGASNQLRDSVVGVFLEAEYERLYEGQPLFWDTQLRLEKDDFRFANEINVQYFHTPSRKYVKMVGEVLYLLRPREGMESVRARKLAWVASAYGIRIQ